MAQFKIKFQNGLPFWKISFHFQERLQLTQNRHQLRCQQMNIFKYLISLFAPLHFQHTFVAPFQGALQLFASSPNASLHLQNLFLDYLGTVHLPRPPHQIVGLINQKQVFAGNPIGKIPFQPGRGIKHIIIIADDSVCPVADIEAEFERTDTKLFGILQNHLSGYGLLLMDHSKNRIIHPIEMSLGKGTVIWIALRLFHRTKLFFRGYCNCGKIKPLFPQQSETLFGHTSGNGFRCQIKQFFSKTFPHRFQRRINSRKCFPNSRRRLNKQIRLSPDSPINRNSQLLLPLPVLIGKGKLL